VKPKDVRRALLSIPVPDELEAQRRGWQVVQAAFAERERISWPRRNARPILAFAVIVALIAAAISPPGRAFVREVREAIGVKAAKEALFSLPSSGRLLVVSDPGAWVVGRDGSRRLLGPYREASWSPTGKYVVVTRRNLLVALEPDGDTRWSLARRGVRLPRWGGDQFDTRIAYLSRRQLRVIAGDGTGDRRLARAVDAVAPAWRPGSPHVLAFVGQGGHLVVTEADSGRRLWSRRLGSIEKLEWSSDGGLLLVQARRFLRVFSPGGQLRYDLLGQGAAPIADASFGPDGRSVAFVQQARGRSDLWVIPRLRPDGSAARRVFFGEGSFADVAWSPDGKWVLVGWEDANQWVFLRMARVRNIQAVNSVTEQFGGGFPSPAGWCCP
jgi:dipeptidyl aminopeptidase/acylaminoacyl peptidase